MNNIYLHVGAHKTASSTIQNNLKIYSQKLLTQGLMYPINLDRDFNFPHRLFISSGNSNPLAYSIRWYNDKKTYKDFDPARVLKVLEPHLINKKCDLILSHEDLLFSPPTFLLLLKRWFNKRNYLLYPVIFLRDQVSWHISNYQQRVRQLNSHDTFAESIAKTLNGPDWALHIRKFEKVFEREFIIVRLFDKQLIKTNIIDYFIKSLGKENIDLDKLEIKSENVGLSFPKAYILSGFNKISDNKKKQKKLYQLMTKLDLLQYEKKISPEMAEFINAYYKNCNLYLIDNYLKKEEITILNSMFENRVCSDDITMKDALNVAIEIIEKLL